MTHYRCSGKNKPNVTVTTTLQILLTPCRIFCRFWTRSQGNYSSINCCNTNYGGNNVSRNSQSGRCGSSQFNQVQGSLQGRAQPMRDDVAMQRRLSLAEPISRMVTVNTPNKHTLTADSWRRYGIETHSTLLDPLCEESRGSSHKSPAMRSNGGAFVVSLFKLNSRGGFSRNQTPSHS